MAQTCKFIDDPALQEALDAAVAAAITQLAKALPELGQAHTGMEEMRGDHLAGERHATILAFPDPTFAFTTIGVSNVFAVQQDVELATGVVRTAGDVLRAGTLSSMFSSQQSFDASLILWEDRAGKVHSLPLSDATPRDDHLFDQAQELGSWVELVKGAGSAWYLDSPTIRLVIDNPHGLQLGLLGFLASSRNPNDDSLNLWTEVLNPPSVLAKGLTYRVDFKIIAVAPLTDNTTYVTPFSAKLAGTPFSDVTLSGTADANAIGTGGDNVIEGNSGANTLAPVTQAKIHSTQFVWARTKEESIFYGLSEADAAVALDALRSLPDLDYRSESVLATIAADWPLLVIDYLADRVRRSRDLDLREFEPLPRGFHVLQKVLPKEMEHLLSVSSELYKEDPASFRFRGVLLVSNVFPKFTPELNEPLLALARKGSDEDLHFLANLLGKYNPTRPFTVCARRSLLGRKTKMCAPTSKWQ